MFFFSFFFSEVAAGVELKRKPRRGASAKNNKNNLTFKFSNERVERRATGVLTLCLSGTARWRRCHRFTGMKL